MHRGFKWNNSSLPRSQTAIPDGCVDEGTFCVFCANARLTCILAIAGIIAEVVRYNDLIDHTYGQLRT